MKTWCWILSVLLVISLLMNIGAANSLAAHDSQISKMLDLIGQLNDTDALSLYHDKLQDERMNQLIEVVNKFTNRVGA